MMSIAKQKNMKEMLKHLLLIVLEKFVEQLYIVLAK